MRENVAPSAFSVCTLVNNAKVGAPVLSKHARAIRHPRPIAMLLRRFLDNVFNKFTVYSATHVGVKMPLLIHR